MFKKVIALKLTVTIFTLGFPALSNAMDNSAYSFGGVCASQGVWVQEALSSTRQIRQIILNLKNDANCKGLGTKIDSYLNSLGAELESIKNADKSASRLSDIPKELFALKTMATSGSEYRNKTLGLIADRIFESSQIQSQAAAGALSEEQAQRIMSMGKRINSSAGAGISMLSSLLDELPNFNNCLSDPNVIGPYLVGAVNMAGAFVNSSKGGNIQTAQLLSKITNYLREDKYASIIKKLNETEFQNSISCLLESASESYCNAVDSRNLLNKSLKEMVEEEKIPGSVLQANNNAAFYGGIKNPFTGIYILNHHIPNISQWLQKVQIGIDPKLPTDSDFKNDTIQIVSDYLQKVNSLKAEYYKQLETIRGFTDEKARSNQVYQLVKSLTSEMIGGRKSSQVNFFLLARNDIELPFALLGIPVPDPVKGIGVAMPVDYDRYLATHPEIFATAPLKIAESIGSNLNQIISAADGASIEYYSKWFIVDKAALVSEATTSMQYTVIDSLKALKNYLELLIEKFERFNGNKTDVPAIIETIDRIEKVLAKIDNLMGLSNEMSSAIAHIDPKTKKLVRLNGEATLKLTDEYRLKIANAYTDVINEIFEQFNVMLSRSGFLSTKFQLWVMSDYSLMLKNKIQLSDYEQSLFISMGNTAVDRISFLLSGNPSTTKDDLDNALRIHKENLLAIESTFKERWYTYTEVAKLISEGKSTAKEIKAAVKDRLDKEYSFMGISSKYLPPIAPMNVIKAILDIAKLWKEYTHPDLYQIPSTMVNTTKYIRENEFHSMNQVYSKMCVQALAFQDQTMFKTLCANAKLISPFSEVAPTSAKLASLNMSYSGRLLNSEKNPTTAETQRICAFRDYHRGNLVQKLTIGRPK